MPLERKDNLLMSCWAREHPEQAAVIAARPYPEERIFPASRWPARDCRCECHQAVPPTVGGVCCAGTRHSP